MRGLLSNRLADGSRFYTPKGARLDVERVHREVEEYFQEGIRLRPGQVVFDVGANVGLFALHAARQCDGDLSIYCFEPIPDIFGALSANFAEHPLLRSTQHRLFQCGLTSSEDRKRTEFYYFKTIPCDSTYDIDAKRRDFEDVFQTLGTRCSSHIERALPGSMGQWLAQATQVFVADLPKGPVGNWVSDRVMGMEKIECALSTLANVVEQESVPTIDLLKIDVEGAEMDVLLGMNEGTWSKVRQVVLEGHDKDGRLNELRQLIEARGLHIGRIGKPEDQEALGLDNFMLTALREN